MVQSNLFYNTVFKEVVKQTTGVKSLTLFSPTGYFVQSYSEKGEMPLETVKKQGLLYMDIMSSPACKSFHQLASLQNVCLLNDDNSLFQVKLENDIIIVVGCTVDDVDLIQNDMQRKGIFKDLATVTQPLVKEFEEFNM